MGFQRKSRRYTLDFEGTDLDGLVAVIRSVPIGVMLDLTALTEASEQTAADLVFMFDTLGESLAEWNLEDEDGQPVAADITGVRTLDVPDAFTLIRAWGKAMQAVPAPLDRPSTAGAPLEVRSLPMEPLSTSRAS